MTCEEILQFISERIGRYRMFEDQEGVSYLTKLYWELHHESQIRIEKNNRPKNEEWLKILSSFDNPTQASQSGGEQEEEEDDFEFAEIGPYVMSEETKAHLAKCAEEQRKMNETDLSGPEWELRGFYGQMVRGELPRTH
jgi:hypothetical protein